MVSFNHWLSSIKTNTLSRYETLVNANHASSNWALNAIFSTCHEICLRKIDLEYENGKQLQVITIKITESKENKSIH